MEIRRLEKIRAKMKSTIPGPGSRVYYVRYADDFLIGINGSYDLAVKIRKEVGKFLKQELKLQLNFDKTHITNTRTGRARFLGADIRMLTSRVSDQKRVKKRTSTQRTSRSRVPNTNIIALAPLETIINKLQEQGICKIKD